MHIALAACTCVHVCVCACADLGVCDGECVDPHAPASPLVLDGVIEEDAEDGVHHLCDLQLLTAARIYKAEREHPLLPHRALQETPTHTHTHTVTLASKKIKATMITLNVSFS